MTEFFKKNDATSNLVFKNKSNKMGEQEFKRTTVIEGNKINTRNVNRRKGNKIIFF